MHLSNRANDVYVPTALDALRLCLMPDEAQVRAIAHLVHRFPSVDVGQLLSMVVNEEGVPKLKQEVIAESARQAQIRLFRRDQKRIGSHDERTVSQRLNRLCRSIFGPIDAWFPLSSTFCHYEGRASFRWLRRQPSGERVAGLDQIGIDSLTTGFVVRLSDDQPSMFAALPTKVGSFEELVVLLGLPPRFLDGRPMRVDWNHGTFIISDTSVLPWVYP